MSRLRNTGSFGVFPLLKRRSSCQASRRFDHPAFSAPVSEYVCGNWKIAASDKRIEDAWMHMWAIKQYLPDVEGYKKRSPSFWQVEEAFRKLGRELRPGVTTLQDLKDAALFYKKKDEMQYRSATCASFSDAKFQGSPGQTGVDVVLAQLQSHVQQWQGLGRYFSPYTTLVNTAMAGKSRVLTELHKQGIFVIYMNFRAPQENGPELWPDRTASIADWATAPRSAAEMLDYTVQTCTLLEHSLQRLCDWLDKQQLEELQAGDVAEARLRRLAGQWQEFVASDEFEFWTLLGRDVQQARWTHWKEAIERFRSSSANTDVRRAHYAASYWRNQRMCTRIRKVQSLLETRLGINAATAAGLRVVFVFDDTDTLGNNQYLWFTRALTALPHTSRRDALAFAVMAGSRVRRTREVVETLEPVRLGLDPVDEMLDPVAKRSLFPALVGVPTVDVWWQAFLRKGGLSDLPLEGVTVEDTLAHMRAQLSLCDSGQPASPAACRAGGEKELLLLPTTAMKVVESFEFMALFGRPAFYAFLQKHWVPGSSEAGDKLQWELQQKLVNQNPNNAPAAMYQRIHADDEISKYSSGSSHCQKRWYTHAQALSVLGAIAALDISASSELAAELVANHLRLVAAVSEQGSSLLTVSVSEPALALAAHRLIMSEHMPWCVLIDKLAASLACNSTLADSRAGAGQLAAQMLLLMAWQKTPDFAADRHGPPLRFAFVSVAAYLEILVKAALAGRRRQLAKKLETLVGLRRRDWRGNPELTALHDALVAEEPLDHETTTTLLKPLHNKKMVAAARELFKEKKSLDTLMQRFETAKGDWRGCSLRLFQFVKTVGPPSQKTLGDYLLRGSGIVCKGGHEGDISLVLPVHDAATGGLGAVLVSVRSASTSNIKSSVARRLSHAEQETFGKLSSSVSLVLELDPTSKKPKNVEIFSDNRKNPTKHTVVISGLTLSDLFPDDHLGANAFNRFIASDHDSFNNFHVVSSSMDKVKSVFATQPYST